MGLSGSPNQKWCLKSWSKLSTHTGWTGKNPRSSYCFCCATPRVIIFALMNRLYHAPWFYIPKPLIYRYWVFVFSFTDSALCSFTLMVGWCFVSFWRQARFGWCILLVLFPWLFDVVCTFVQVSCLLTCPKASAWVELPRQALNIFQSVMASVQRSIVSYSALLNAFETASAWKKCQDVFVNLLLGSNII